MSKLGSSIILSVESVKFLQQNFYSAIALAMDGGAIGFFWLAGAIESIAPVFKILWAAVGGDDFSEGSGDDFRATVDGEGNVLRFGLNDSTTQECHELERFV